MILICFRANQLYFLFLLCVVLLALTGNGVRAPFVCSFFAVLFFPSGTGARKFSFIYFPYSQVIHDYEMMKYAG